MKGQSPCDVLPPLPLPERGNAPDTSADDSALSVDVAGFDGLTGKVKKALADDVGDSVDVSLKRGGRFYFVDEHGTKHRVSASDLYGVLDAYPTSTCSRTSRATGT